MVSSDLWDADTAERYDVTSAFMFRPEVLDPAVERLADLAGDGPALEFAIGTGQVALPLNDGGVAVPFHVGPRHTGFDTFDLATQRGISHHYERQDDGTFRYGTHHYRYVWPAECDHMAQLAGLTLERRMADWHGAPFTGDSASHVSVWRKPSS